MNKTILKAAVAAITSVGFASMTAAQSPASDLASLSENAPVSVREGDTWSKATFVKKEGRRYLIKYEDGTEEWVTADRLKVADDAKPGDVKPGATKPDDAKSDAPKAPEKPKYDTYTAGQAVEFKWGGTWEPAKVIRRQGDWYLLEYTKWNGWREWGEPWRIRKVGSNYDIDHVRGNPRVNGNEGPPRATPGDPPDAPGRPGAGKPGEPRAGGSRPDPFSPPPIDFPIIDAKEGGQDVLPVAAEWSYKPVDQDPKTRIPANATPITLPPIKGRGADYTWMRQRGSRVVIPIGDCTTGVHGGSYGLVRADLATRTAAGFEIPSKSMVLDMSPSGNIVACQSAGFHSGTSSRLDIYKLNGTQVEHVVSYFPGAGKTDIRDVRFVDETTLVTLAGSQLVAWEFATAKPLWRMDVSARSALGQTSDGSVIAASTSEGIALLEGKWGKVLGVIDSQLTGAMAFSSDGKTLTIFDKPMLDVWDLQTNTKITAMAVDKKIAGPVLPLSSDFVLAGEVLYDVRKMTPVWLYQGDGAAIASGNRVVKLLKEGAKPILASAEIPHPKAKAAAEKAGGGALLMQKGSKVSLDIQAELDQPTRDKVIDNLKRQLTDAGITVADGQPLRIVARTGAPQTEQKEYERRAGFDRTRETVTITRRTTTLLIEFEGTELWSTASTSSNDPGMMVSLKDGQTIQDAVNSQRQGSSFLVNIKIPTALAAPVDLATLPASTWALGGVKDR